MEAKNEAFEFRVEAPGKKIVFEHNDLFKALDRLKQEEEALLYRNKDNAILASVGEVKRTKIVRTKDLRPKEPRY